jgi:hypothetical protein
MIKNNTVHACGLLRSARHALTDGGSIVILEPSSGDSLEATGGPGFGSLGLPHRRLTELAREAGFSHVRRAVDSPPAHVVYEVTP